MDNFDYQDYITQARRQIHARPEIAYKEFETQNYITARLDELSVPYEKVGTGIIARLLLGRPKTIGFRADIDALPITEANDVSYRSKNEGFMHACGHDGHTAMLLAFIRYCAVNPDKMQANAVFIFQPAEESEGGAITMIEGGALNGIDEIYALHVDPQLPEGVAGLKPGPLMAGTYGMVLEFLGESSHCAEKEKGRDALHAAVEALTGIYDSIPKSLKGKVLYHAGKISGGYAKNVVADNVRIECTIRYFEDSHLQTILSVIKLNLSAVADKFGVKASIIRLGSYIPLINNREAVDKVKKHIKYIDIDKKFTGEDFAFYLKKVKGALIWLGVNTGEEPKRKLHSPWFDFDEKALIHGFKLFVSLIEEKY